jgi:chemotaxis protein histidine kinase CheA
MPAAIPFIVAGAALTTAATGVGSAIVNGIGQSKSLDAQRDANSIALKELEIQAERLGLDNEQLGILKEQLGLEKEGVGLQREGLSLQRDQLGILMEQLGNDDVRLELEKAGFDLEKQRFIFDQLDSLRGYNREIGGYQEAMDVIENVDIPELSADIESYDRWLSGYGAMVDREEKAQAAKMAQLEAAGIESYNSFLDAIGYSDALAGATGRIGGGTSAGEAARDIDARLVRYAGEDRALDASGGTYGAMVTAANAEYEGILASLLNEKQGMEGTRKVAAQARDYYQGKALPNLQSNIGAAAGAYTNLALELYRAFDVPLPESIPEEDRAAAEQAKAEAEAKAKAEAEAKAKSEAEAKAKSEAEAKAKVEAEAKAKAEAEAKAKVEAEAKAKAEAEAKAKSEAEMWANLNAQWEKMGNLKIPNPYSLRLKL